MPAAATSKNKAKRMSLRRDTVFAGFYFKRDLAEAGTEGKPVETG